MRRFLTNAWQVAWMDVREYFRQRPALAMFAQPLIFLAVVVALPGIIAANTVVRPTAVVAVQGAPSQRDALAERLHGRRVRLVATENAEADTRAGRADVGVIVRPDDSLNVIVARTREKSRNGYGALEASLGHAAGGGELRVSRVEFSKTPRGQQLAFAHFFPFYILVQLMAVVSIGMTHFVGSAAKRATEPLLVLPYGRGEIATGKALFAATTGVLSLTALIVPVVAVDALGIALLGVRISIPADAFIAAVVAALALLPLLGALAALAGSAASTPGQADVYGNLVALAPVLIAGALTFAIQGALPAWLLLVPVIGTQIAVREAVSGTTSLVHLALVVGASAVWTAALLMPTGRLLSRDRMVLRPSE